MNRLKSAVSVLLLFCISSGLIGCKSADEKAISLCLADDRPKFEKTLLEFEMDPKQEPTSLMRKYLEAIAERDASIDELKLNIENKQSERLKDVIALLRIENEIVRVLSTSFEVKESFASFDFKALEIKFEELSELEEKLAIRPRTEIAVVDEAEGLYRANLSTELDRKLNDILKLDAEDFEKPLLTTFMVLHVGETEEENALKVFKENIQKREEVIRELALLQDFSPRAQEIEKLLVLENKAVLLLEEQIKFMQGIFLDEPESYEEFLEKAKQSSANLKSFKQALDELQDLPILEKSLRDSSLSYKSTFDELLDTLTKFDEALQVVPESNPKKEATAGKNHSDVILKDFELAKGMPGWSEVAAMVDSIPRSYPESIARGKKFYEANCALCHGVTGLGDGGGGAGLNPPPRNLTVTSEYKYGHLELALYRTATYGIEGTGMAPWDGILSPEDTWDIVHYVRSIQR